MEMVCPECLGTLETTDGQSARCTTHGGQFQILFSHWRSATLPPVITSGPVFSLEPGAMCAQHGKVAAVHACSDCGAAMCQTCTFQDTDGTSLCAGCITARAAAPPPAAFSEPLPPPIPQGVHCVQHRAVAATSQCKLCGAFMCATCDFTLPGNLHVCPPCATAPRSELSPRRKRCLWGSFGLAIFATVGMGVFLSGLLAGMGQTKEGESLLGILFSLFALVPALVGMGMGFSAIDKRLSNPMSLWVATIWNVVLVAVFVLLCVRGIFTG